MNKLECTHQGLLHDSENTNSDFRAYVAQMHQEAEKNKVDFNRATYRRGLGGACKAHSTARRAPWGDAKIPWNEATAPM